MSKLFVCINFMIESVGNIVYFFNRRPIVFKKLIMFLRAIFFFGQWVSDVLHISALGIGRFCTNT